MPRRASPERHNSQIEAKIRFDNTLMEIANHMFVTDASVQKRKKLKKMYDKTAKMLGENGIYSSICIPAGSVAVGMSLPESDVDALVLYESNLSPDDLKARKVESEYGFDLIQVNGLFKKNTVSDLFNASRKYNDDSYLDLYAFLFFPALKEFTNPKSKVLIDSWRRKVLRQFVDSFPDNAMEIWDMIRNRLDDYLIHYENTESVHEPFNKRQIRVTSVFEDKINKRFPGDSVKQTRAVSIIQAKRDSFQYPEFNDMLQAFGIAAK